MLANIRSFEAGGRLLQEVDIIKGYQSISVVTRIVETAVIARSVATKQSPA